MQIEQASFAQAPAEHELARLNQIEPQLVLVFGAVSALTRPGLLAQLTKAFPTAELAGCTTAG